jgi:hypothetical protein
MFFPIISIMAKNRHADNEIPYFSSSARIFSMPHSQSFLMRAIVQISTILHNLHNFRTILVSRQWVALFESRQIQA